MGASDKFVTNLDWNLLRTFVVIVEEGGITAAATRLLRRQPTVSAALGRLEAQIGSRLIERGGGAFRLTAAGRALYRECSEIYGAVSRLGDLAQDATKELTGHVELPVASHVVTPILDQTLAEFHRTYPEVTFEITVDTSRAVQQRVLEKSAPLGICLVSRRIARLDYEMIYREYFGFFCGPSHPLYGRGDLDISDLRGCAGVSFETDSVDDALRPVAVFRRDHGLDHNIVGRSTHLEEVRRLIACGLGIGPLPIHVMRQDIEQGTLWRLPPYDDPPAIDIFVVTNPTSRLTRAESRFLAALKSQIAARPFAERTYGDVRAAGLAPAAATQP
ncbi:LysR substrate-binding domain-containing protein [Roseovarius salis]|uniref:LysR family transcriptional regulator n=1 Tax=Roseovarius salis TaxID=3376063 RepID=UPI0037CBD102